MPRLCKPRVLILVALAALLIALAAAGQYQRLFERTWFHLIQTFGEPPPQSLGLPDYRAVIQAKPIDGLPADVSALTFDPQRRSLFTVTNKRSELVELSLDGTLLRRIALRGFGDPEAVEYIRPGLFVITDEGASRLLAVRIDDATTGLDAADAEQLVLNLGEPGNRGFEGLAYDPARARLYVAKEQRPMLIYEISGFPRAGGPTSAIEISQNRQRDAGLFVRDLSSLLFDKRNGHLLALSDESRLLVELDGNDKPIGTLSLRRGNHGLERTVPQAEGIALDDQGTLYLVSEPNLFYVFKKPEPGA